jgi:hypothetical protein
MEIKPLKVGTGSVVHVAKSIGKYESALCGVKPNRTGGILRIAYLVSSETPITCAKCLALVKKITEETRTI